MGTKAVLAERCAATSRDIRDTRERIAAATGTVRDRIRPRALLNPVRSRLRETLGEGGEKILDTFRDNPIPLALTGIGLGWLILRDLRGKEAADSGAGGGLEKMKESAGEAVEKTREAAHKIRDAAAAVPGKVQEGVRKTSDWFFGMLEENPLLMAVGILAVGMAAGLSFPAGAKEEETIGKVGGKAAEAALRKGAEVLEKTGGVPSTPEEPKATGLAQGSQSAE